jgi:hypothetical protein
MSAWWTRPAVRLPILLAMLAGVSAYGVPRIVHEAAGAPRPQQCSSGVRSEPASTRLDQKFWIDDGRGFGAWARSGPCDGTWYLRQTTPPPDGGRWYPTGRTVDIDCARVGAVYPGHVDYRPVSWSTWLHIRRGGWLPSIIATQVPRNSVSGLPTC